MITIAQCSDSLNWDKVDRLCFQIYNGINTTYVRSDTPSSVKSLGNKDFNKYHDDVYPFYYKEKK